MTEHTPPHDAAGVMAERYSLGAGPWTMAPVTRGALGQIAHNSRANSPTSSGSSLNPPSASTDNRNGSDPRVLAGRSVSSRVAAAPSGRPAAAATPRLVVPTARKPCPARARAEAWSQALGRSRGSSPW
ncbi:hypothetical protein GCM10010104_65710 [Streptomyces indiaensis]|uniref:Uncharacterized protein n=1 Tax=Streptomyces indiaensis TaxID=284033 RepID=A0ABN3EHC9_9ACTN